MSPQPETPAFDADAAAVIAKYDELLHTVGPEEAVRASYTPDAAFHLLGNHRLSGTNVGHDGIIAFYDRVGALVDMPSNDCELVIAGGGWVTEIRRAVLVRNGEEYVFDEVVNYRVAGDRIAEVWVVPVDPAATDAFLS